MKLSKLKLPRCEDIPFTSAENGSGLYKTPIIRRIFALRIDLCLRLLDNFNPVLLDIGTGCGVLLPSLAQQGKFTIGLDVHKRLKLVQSFLKEGLHENVALIRADAHYLPFKDESFNSIICVSVLDHLNNPLGAVKDVGRVLNKNGVAVMGFHVQNKIFDMFHFFFVLLTKLLFFRSLTNVRKHLFSEHEYSYNNLMKILSSSFHVEKMSKISIVEPLYACLKCKKMKD